MDDAFEQSKTRSFFSENEIHQYLKEDVQPTYNNKDSADKYRKGWIKAKARVVYGLCYQGDLLGAYRELELFDEVKEKMSSFKENTQFVISLNVASGYIYGHLNKEGKMWVDKALALALTSPNNGLKDSHLIRMYNMLGDLACRNGDKALARSYIQKAREIFDKGTISKGNKCDSANSWIKYNMAEILLEEANDEKILLKDAEELILSALEERKQIGDPRLLAYSYEALTRLEIQKGDFLKAKQYYYIATAYIDKFNKNHNKEKKLGNSDFFIRGRCECNLGRISYREDREAGKEKFRKGIEILDQTLPQGNNLSVQYKQEYEILFNEPYEVTFDVSSIMKKDINGDFDTSSFFSENDEMFQYTRNL